MRTRTGWQPWPFRRFGLGDGNEDKVVNGQDLAFWRKFAELAMGGSSWYDFNLDGMTDPADLVIIKKNLGTKCLPKK